MVVIRYLIAIIKKKLCHTGTASFYYINNFKKMKNQSKNIFRREFLKGLGALPFLGYFAFNVRENIAREARLKHKDYLNLLGVENLEAPKVKLLPSTGNANNRIRFGLIGNGWRGDQLLQNFGFIHPNQVKENTVNGKYNEWLTDFSCTGRFEC